MKFKVLYFTLLLYIMMTSCAEETVKERINPLTEAWDTPYQIPPFNQIQATDYISAFDRAFIQHAGEIEEIINSDSEVSFETVILPFDRAGQTLENLSNLFFALSQTNSSPQMQEVELEILPLLSSHFDHIMMNDMLFEKVQTVYNNRNREGLDSLQIRLTEKIYTDFVRSGALLSADQKTRLQQINAELATLEVRFDDNLLSDHKSFELIIPKDKENAMGLPQVVTDIANANASQRGLSNKYVFTLDQASLIPFLTYADSTELRKTMYEAYISRGNNDNEFDNKEIVRNIVKLRAEMAQLLGYKNYAEYALEVNMAKTPQNVYSLLDDIWQEALKKSQQELTQMKRIKKNETGIDSFDAWDWWYYAEKLRKSEHSIEDQFFRPYFSLVNVRGAIFDLFNRLYGLTFRPISAPSFNDQCMIYEVLDVTNTHLGIIYLDLFPRNGKATGAWCNEIRAQHYTPEGERITPIIGLNFNFSQVKNSIKSLLSLDEVETFFHEFGHAVHFLLSDVPYRGLREVELDFVELPSQIMENWAFEAEFLEKYCFHYNTDKPLDKSKIQDLIDSKSHNQGFATQEYLAAAYLDMDIHSLTDVENLDLNNFAREMLNNKRGLVDEIAPRYALTNFSHIFGSSEYSAGYYSYIWAEVLDKDAYSFFTQDGKDIYNKEKATLFLQEILSKASSDDGMNLFYNFRGEQQGKDALLISKGFKKKVVSTEEMEKQAAEKEKNAMMERERQEEQRLKEVQRRQEMQEKATEDRSKRLGNRESLR